MAPRHCHWCGLEADGEQGVIVATRQMARAGADFIKVMATGGGMTRNSNITEPQYTVAELSAIRREATRLGRRVTAHSHAGKGQQNCLDAGIGHCRSASRGEETPAGSHGSGAASPQGGGEKPDPRPGSAATQTANGCKPVCGGASCL